MNTKTFRAFRNLVYDKSGISLKDGKEALIYARVGKRMRALGIATHKEYLERIAQDESGQEVVHLLDAISTNVTSFFRGPDHFEFLTRQVKEWRSAGQDRLRIWSAACSTGEEPYSIAMTILDALNEACDTKILATDISTRALDTAQLGTYGSDRSEQVPKIFRTRYFDKVSEFDTTFYTAKPMLRQMITFGRLNLSTPPFPMRGPLDVVFCRNVMIYFDNHIRLALITEIHRLLKQHGYLILGHSESLLGMMSGFKSVQPSVYLKLN